MLSFLLKKNYNIRGKISIQQGTLGTHAKHFIPSKLLLLELDVSVSLLPLVISPKRSSYLFSNSIVSSKSFSVYITVQRRGVRRIKRDYNVSKTLFINYRTPGNSRETFTLGVH